MTQHNLSLQTIRIEREAADYVREYGGHVMVRRSPRHGCCGGRVYLPVVDLGSPAEAEKYLTIQQDEIVIHMDRVLFQEQHMAFIIGLSRWWRWSELWVEESK
jgi:hypothetical protein